MGLPLTHSDMPSREIFIVKSGSIQSSEVTQPMKMMNLYLMLWGSYHNSPIISAINREFPEEEYI
jgi:hypothetical protein